MSETSLPVSPRLIDRHFRWRGHDVTRIEGFSDAVFSIVLALLFLRAMPPENFTEVKAAMKGLVPFVATFAIIAYVWIEHWLFYRRYDLHDGTSTFLNLVLLFLLLFYTYPLKYLFTLMSVQMFGNRKEWDDLKVGIEGDADVVLLFVYYGVGYGAIFGVLALMYARAHALRDKLALDPVETLLTRSGIVQCLLQVGVAVGSILLALTVGVGRGLPGWIYCAIGPLMAWHGTREGRKVQRLLATK